MKKYTITSITLALSALFSMSAVANETVYEKPFNETAMCVSILESDLKKKIHGDETHAERQAWLSQIELLYALAAKAHIDGLSKDEGKKLVAQAEAYSSSWSKEKISNEVEFCNKLAKNSQEKAAITTQTLIRMGAANRLQKEVRKANASKD